MTSTPTRQASAIECQKTKRRIVPSWPNQLVAVEATTIDCASIILPMTPPEELAAPIRIGDKPNCSDVIFCRFPNRMFAQGRRGPYFLRLPKLEEADQAGHRH